jgi:hypothetical protein
MARENTSITKMIFRQLFSGSAKEMKAKNPMVLSCGGVYIPRKGGRKHSLYHILHTPSDAEPVKVYCAARQKSALIEMIQKESLN